MKKIIIYITILLFALTKVASSQVATIQTLDGSYGSTQADVTLSGFATNVGAITMHIVFDPNVASFTGITNGIINSGIIYNVAGNVINISWAENAGAANGVVFKLDFNYTGGSCPLSFNQSEIADASANIVQTTFLNGAINQPALTTTATIANQPGAYNVVNELPVAFSGFPISPLSSKVGAITLNIGYNSSNLDFIGITGLSGAIVNATGGVININWYSATPIDLNTIDLKLQFNYLGGTSAVQFTGINTIDNVNGVQIPVSFINGGITQPSTVALVDIGDAVGNVSGTTTVPVVFSSFPQNQGAVTMNIAYNNSAVNFVGTSGLTGLVANAANGVIHLTWYNSGGMMIPGFNLLFNYLGGSSNLEFTGQNEITNTSTNIIPVSYTNGTVTQTASTVNVSIGNNAYTGSSQVLVPIIVTGLTGNDNATTMYVNFDQTKLTFVEAVNNTNGAIVNQDYTTKTIIITGTSLGNGTFLNLKFIFNGGAGNCDVPVYFTAFNSNMSSLTDASLNPVIANWINGSVNASPIAYTVTGGGSYCAGGTGVLVGLSNSQLGVNYQLKVNTVNTGSSMTGTAAALSFGLQTATGTYTVEATNGPGSTCTTMMLGAATVIINPLPTAVITGNQTINLGGTATLTINVTGDGPWSGTLSDGSSFINEPTSPITVTVNPTATTTYTLVSLTDENCTADISGLTGSATVTVNPLAVNAKVILQGAWNGTLMNTTLNSMTLIPLIQPYNTTPWNYSGAETVISIPNVNVVDWVLVELRLTANGAAVGKRAGFILKDGSIVDTDGSSLLKFPGLNLANYFIVIRHRNHLPVMSATAQALSSISVLYDFTDNLSKAYKNNPVGNNAMATLSGAKFGMWGGDVNKNGIVRYGGPANDPAAIFNLISNSVIVSYHQADVNMNGIARYGGPANDPAAIFNFVGNIVTVSQIP